MAVCAHIVTLSDGSQVLALDPASADVATCAYVVQSGFDVSNNFLAMTAEDGGIFSAGLISVWFAAWGLRQIITVVRGGSEEI